MSSMCAVGDSVRSGLQVTAERIAALNASQRIRDVNTVVPVAPVTNDVATGVQTFHTRELPK